MVAKDWVQIVAIPLLTTFLTLVGGYFTLGRQHRLDVERLHTEHEQAMDRMRQQMRLDLERGRQDELRQRLDDLKEQAGFLYNNLNAWVLLQPYDVVWSRFTQLNEATGRYAEHRTVYAALKAFLNTTGYLLKPSGSAPPVGGVAAFQDRQEYERLLSELEEHYAALVAACNQLLDDSGLQSPKPE